MDTVLENFMEELGGKRTHMDIMLQFLEEGGISREEADNAGAGAGNGGGDRDDYWLLPETFGVGRSGHARIRRKSTRRRGKGFRKSLS